MMMKNDQSSNRTGNRWTMFTWIIVTALLLSSCGSAPQAKVYHVGIMSTNASFADIGNGFKAKMTELGYIQDKNIIYVETALSVDPVELQRMAKQLVDAKVDLIVTFPAQPTVAAKVVTQSTTIPVVFAYMQIEGSNVVNSVREPGGNMTGVRYPGPELITQRLSLLLQMAPKVKRIWIGYNKNGPNIAAALEALRPAATQAGVTLVEAPATTLDDIKADLAARANSADPGMDAIMGMPDEFNTSPAGFAVLSKFAADHKIPIAGGLASQANQGALFINGTDFKNVGALAATLADKILRGTQAGTVPVVTPEQILIINYKVAQQLVLTVPDGLLRLANQIIK